MIPCDYLKRTDVPIEPGLCFVIMPFGGKMDSIYDAGIKPALEKLGMRPQRADESFMSTDIMSDVLDSILRAEIVITDLTGRNPNVFYELGLAHAVKQNVVLITQSKDDVPFDLAGIRYFVYENTMVGAKNLSLNLEKIIRQIRATPSPQTAELKHVQEILQRAFKAWISIGDIIINLSEFSTIVLYIDELALDNERIAFMAVNAAYFGRHLAKMISKISANKIAIKCLVDTIACSPMLRPAWRSAAMLEKCDITLVKDAIKNALSLKILNQEREKLLKEIVPKKKTFDHLKDIIDSDSIPLDTRSKADEAHRQLTAEFSLSN